MMDGSTMICETVWDEAPSRVVFKGRNEWGAYIPERTCKWEERYDGEQHVTGCGATVFWEGSMPPYCMYCGARVERDA